LSDQCSYYVWSLQWRATSIRPLLPAFTRNVPWTNSQILWLRTVQSSTVQPTSTRCHCRHLLRHGLTYLLQGQCNLECYCSNAVAFLVTCNICLVAGKTVIPYITCHIYIGQVGVTMCYLTPHLLYFNFLCYYYYYAFATTYSTVLFFSSSWCKCWPHHGCTCSIYLCLLSFWLTLSRGVLSTSWCCPSRPFVSSSLVYTWYCSLHYLFLQPTPLFSRGVAIVSVLWQCLTVPSTVLWRWSSVWCRVARRVFERRTSTCVSTVLIRQRGCSVESHGRGFPSTLSLIALMCLIRDFNHDELSW